MKMSTTPALRRFAAVAALTALTSNFAAAQQEDHPAFEWGGIYLLPEGVSELVVQPGPEGSIDIALVPVADASAAAFDEAVAAAISIFAGEPHPVHPGEEFVPGSEFLQLRVDLGAEMRFPVRAPSPGHYALFTQHFADEFQVTFVREREPLFPIVVRDLVERFGQIVILPAALEAFNVVLAPVGYHLLIPSFIAPARVSYDAERMAHVGSAVSGRVVELTVRLGDTVQAGEILALVDSPELGAAQSDYLLRRTLAESAAPAVEVARNSYERARKLYDEKQSISLTEVQRRQAELLAAEAAVLNAGAALLDAANRLQLLGMREEEVQELSRSGTISSRHPVRAPIEGRVIRRDVTLGELVRPDQAALLVLADTTRLWVLVDVPETRLKDVTIGATARIALAAFPESAVDGVVSFVNPDLDATTRTAQIRVEMLNPLGQILPGMFAQVEIVAGGNDIKDSALRGVLAVPEAAIQTVEGRPVVFVPLPEHPDTFVKRPVTVGTAVGGIVPVTYGLRAGELIVSANSFIFKAQLGKSSAKHEH